MSINKARFWLNKIKSKIKNSDLKKITSNRNQRVPTKMMIKSLILTSVLLIVSMFDLTVAKRASIYSLDPNDVKSHWSAFKTNHTKKYHNSTHEDKKSI